MDFSSIPEILASLFIVVKVIIAVFISNPH